MPLDHHLKAESVDSDATAAAMCKIFYQLQGRQVLILLFLDVPNAHQKKGREEEEK